MSEKRKDKRGRVLRTGETQRTNGTYDYRYTNARGKRHSVYAETLDELRRKEHEIQRDLEDGLDYAAGEMSVAELIDRYIEIKGKMKDNSVRAYSTGINRIHKDAFGQRRIRDVKLSDAKRWYLSLHDEGLKFNTINVVHCLMRPAFEMAVNDDIIRKNPFKFKLAELIPYDAEERVALTKDQVEQYLSFIREHGSGNYYNDIVILAGTGMRVSELYGLTKSDLDFERRRIYVSKQLCRTADKPYFVTEPKSKSGNRCIPMSDSVCEAFRRELQRRAVPKIESIIDGYSGFIFLDKNGMPKVAMNLQGYMRCMQKKYAGLHGESVPKVMPHILRHTFCTNAHYAGLDDKSLQTIMGHSRIEETFNTYTHTDYDTVQRAFDSITLAFNG